MNDNTDNEIKRLFATSVNDYLVSNLKAKTKAYFIDDDLHVEIISDYTITYKHITYKALQMITYNLYSTDVAQGIIREYKKYIFSKFFK